MVTPISGLDIVTIAGRKTKAFTAPLNPGVDVLYVMALRAKPGPWLDTPLPFDIGANYQQSVNPFIWGRCATFIAHLIRTGSTDARIPGACQLMRDKLAEFSVDGAFQYRFPRTFHRDLKVNQPPFVSALGNGNIIAGALELYATTNESVWADIAYKHLLKLMLGPTDTDFVTLDASSWLWLEETPPVTRLTSTTPERTRVLNGHAGALFALYHWLQMAGSDAVVDLHVRAAAATAATYYDRTRNPGKVMDYWLFDKTPDYGPTRAVNFVTTLGQMTGNQVFYTLRDAFLTDIPVNK